jgi:hypothetical protein
MVRTPPGEELLERGQQTRLMQVEVVGLFLQVVVVDPVVQ